MDDKAPQFSIVLPTRNRQQMLERAIASVRRQRYTDFELIVVDDAGDDGRMSIGPLDDAPMRVLRSETPLGAAGARNLGLSVARGRYVSFLDDDDEYLESFLAATLDTFRAAPTTVGICWSGVKQIDYPSQPGGPYGVRVKSFAAGPRDPSTSLEDLVSIGTGFGVTVKNDCVRAVGGFDSRLKTVEDIDLFLRIVEAGFSAAAVPGVHVVVHNHRMPRLTDPALHRLRICECQLLLTKHASFLDGHQPVRARLLDHVDLLQQELDDPDARERPLVSTAAGAPSRGWPSMSRWSDRT